ncbi:MAG TPA: PH domain-containing protein [Flavisolibacter sp.]|nr:PH domain-containing protein [Flavisolibacter sp.]
MEPIPPPYNWETPQRQPITGLVVVFIKTFWEIIKRVWPFFLWMLFDNQKDKPDEQDKFELLVVLFIALTVVSSILKFLYFRFQIINEELIIHKGWLKKTTVIVPLHKIQTIHIEQSFLHQFLGIVKAGIDTAGSKKTEVSIDALHLSMAKALQARVQAIDKQETPTAAHPMQALPLLRLSGKDLLRLSLSANHIEAFFILLSFVYGVYDNLKRVSENVITDTSALLPDTLFFISFFILFTLCITVLISTTRIVLKFYDYKVWQQQAGFYIKGGLTSLKEQFVPFSKVQYITWRANWVRKQLGLWMLEYKIAGSDEVKASQKVEVPITQSAYIATLVTPYAAIPGTAADPIRIHASFVYRRLLMVGFLPALVLIAGSWFWWQEKALIFLLLPLFVGLKAALLQKRFRLYAYSDLVYINRSSYGSTYTLLPWYKLQSVSLQQNIYQRKHNLASLLLYTASGNISLPYISLEAAHAIVNYALYQVEANERPWM